MCIVANAWINHMGLVKHIPLLLPKWAQRFKLIQAIKEWERYIYSASRSTLTIVNEIAADVLKNRVALPCVDISTLVITILSCTDKFEMSWISLVWGRPRFTLIVRYQGDPTEALGRVSCVST
jgi:hypothetical protein